MAEPVPRPPRQSRPMRALLLVLLLGLFPGPTLADETAPAPSATTATEQGTEAQATAEGAQIKTRAASNPPTDIVPASELWAETVDREDAALVALRLSYSFETEKLKVATAREFVIYTLIFAFIFILIFAIMQLFNKSKGNFPKYLIVAMVITASILLLLMGYTEAQIAPAFGLLGTILGYIFGRSEPPKPTTPSSDGGAAGANAPPKLGAG